MRIGGQLLLTDGGCRLAPGIVELAGARLVAVGPWGSGAVLDAGGAECVILPGLIDAHVHLPQFDSIGRAGMPLLEWLDRVVYPAEARWADADVAGEMGARVARQLLSFGTTGVAAYGTVHAEGTRAAARALADAGLRGIVGQVLMDRGAPAALTRPADQLLREAGEAESIGRIRPAVTPRFAISCTGELLRGAGDLAAGTGWTVQTHLAETRDECAEVSRLFGGARYVEVYARAGLLRAGAIFGHGIWIDEADRAAIARSGAVIAHCPTANEFLGSGAMDRSAAIGAGVRVALGSDVAGGPDRSMVRVARAMVETARRLGRQVPAAEAWEQITSGNADALGWADAGRLRAGGAADLVVVRPDIPWMDSPDPLATLLFAWDDRWITHTFAGGAVVYERG